ncbi:MAG: ROK family transcriptional regulator [Pseudomonadota bacterium]
MTQELTDTDGAFPSSEVMGAKRDGIRARNERLILSLIHRDGAMAKADIARATGLSAQTVSVIMRNLEADGLLRRGEPVRGRVGQPSVPMGLDPDGAFALGLKVGRRSLDMVLIDFAGTVRKRLRRTHRYPTPDETVAFACDAVVALRDHLAPGRHHRIAGLGIAIPFALWDWGTTIGASDREMEQWRDRDIARELSEQTECAVWLQNDASAACGAELTFGPRDRVGDFVYVYIAYFAGGGIVQGGRLYTGPRGNAGALGSIPIPDSSGTTRQLIDVASLSGLETRLTELGLSPEVLWGPPESWEVDDCALGAWVEEAARGLACAIVASTAVTDASLVLIDGWLPVALRARLVTATRAQLERIPHIGIDLPTVEAGSIGPDARALGAASLPLWERYFLDSTAS